MFLDYVHTHYILKLQVSRDLSNLFIAPPILRPIMFCVQYSMISMMYIGASIPVIYGLSGNVLRAYKQIFNLIASLNGTPC